MRLTYSEPVLERIRPPSLARWVLQQARLLAVKLPADVPVRREPRDWALSAARPGVHEQPVQLLLRTASVEVGARWRRPSDAGPAPVEPSSRGAGLPGAVLAAADGAMSPTIQSPSASHLHWA